MTKIQTFLENEWRYRPGDESAIIRALKKYITIENDSPDFDKNWRERGEMFRVVDLFVDTIEKLKKEYAAQGCRTDDIIVTTHGRSEPEYDTDGNVLPPLLVVDIPAYPDARYDAAVLLYGHLDKQPGLDEKWTPGLGPRTPVITEDGKLYGRGGADDGYALFSAFSAVMALRRENIPHARSIILIESCEESGSIGLEHYLKALKKKLGNVTLIVCLDSGCENYEQLWLTTSLRGVVNGVLDVRTIRDGVHSGDGSGIIPSSFRILTQLIARIENQETGEILPETLKVPIRKDIREQATRTAEKLGEDVFRKYNFLKEPDVKPVTDNLVELVLNRSWRAQLSVTGIDGLPRPDDAGNVMLPETKAKLSFRLPPTLDSGKAGECIQNILTANPPYNAHVQFTLDGAGNGWAAPELAPWLDKALADASAAFFGTPYLTMGEGGSIPFMGLLGEMFPAAQFIITGVLGPHSNAHGPDEFLDIPTAAKVSMCVAHCLREHCANARG